KNLAERGDEKRALKLTKRLHKKAGGKEQSHTRIGALNLLASLDPAKAPRLLRKAALSPATNYRNAALALVVEGDLKNDIDFWAKLLNKADNPAKADILRKLGQLEGDE